MKQPLITALALAATLTAGCTPAVPRPPVTFAVLAGSYYSARGEAAVEAAVVEESETLLRRAVADVNARENVDFVLVAGDLLARADPLSLDCARAILDDLRVPYFVVLGDHDGPALPTDRGEAAGAPASADEAPRPPAAGGISRSTVLWTFQGRGISGPEGYWVREVPPGVVVVGLDTVNPGRRGGHVDARQLQWLDETLTAHQGRMVLVVAHHGLVPLHPLDEGEAWSHLMVDNAPEVRDVLKRHPNVVMVVTAHHHFAGGRIAGRIVYLASPSLSVWPMAYHLVRVDREEAEAVWVSPAPAEVARRGMERLLESERLRGVFPTGEDGDTACVRLFGGNKMKTYRLPAIRP
ncbi:MAG: metallophosphoesterase [Phycisphaerae bacterium]